MGMALMELPDRTILKHKVPYDPVKAHEYYLRIRELKGRKKGQVGVSAPRELHPSYTVRLHDGKTVHLSAKQLAEQKAYAAKRVSDIKDRLAELGSELRKMMSEAKKKSVKSKRDAEKKPTVAEKSKAARESKQYREKHRAKLAAKRKSPDSKKSDSVAELEHKISKIKGRLKVAVQIQLALITATKNG
jgi:hypothetical protein